MADGGGQLEIKILGSLDVRREGEELALGGTRARSVLAVLLLGRNEVVPRERLIDAVWGETPPAGAVNALQVHVSGLRRALGEDRIERRGTGYRLRVEPDELDLDQVERIAARARTGAASATELERALALWSGAVALDSYSDAVRHELARLSELRAFLLEERFEADLAAGRHGALVEELEAALAEYPYRERFRSQLMVALYRAGRQAEALEVYVRTRRMFLDDLGIEPGQKLKELEARILRQDPELDPPAAAPSLQGVGLPAPPTPLVGRGLELGAVTALLRMPHVRLLTLTGIGGSGKTRVAIAAAAELRGEYADGAHFVDLAPVTRPEIAIEEMARALGVSSGGESASSALAEALRDRHVLLVTDNFEHLPAAAPDVARLLAAAPGLDVLATSRGPLHLAAEHEYPIRPLEPPRQTRDPTVLKQNEAVALFTNRARAVRPDFEVTEENAAAVAAICTAVDGLPLALELAAARVKLLSAEELLARLRDRLDMLTTRAQDVPERQRTIRAAIDWSYDLVDSRERSLFAQLSVFPGTFSLAAAEAICACDLTGLEALADSSLLQPVGEQRFRMLEVVRQRAAERLVEAGGADAARHRHLVHFIEFAEELQPTLRGAAAEASYGMLEEEHDQFRAALGFARDTAQELQLRLARALQRFWSLHGYLSEGREWLESALRADGTQSPHLRAQALAGVGAIAWRQHDVDAAERFAAEAVEILRDLGDDRELVGPLSVLGAVAARQGDYGKALAFHEESGQLARRADDGYGVAMSLNNQAYAAWMTADVDRAGALWEECLSAAREAGTTEVAALATSGLGDVALARGTPESAGQRFRDALASFVQLGFPELQADTCVCLAAVAKAESELGRAAQLLGVAASLRQVSGAPEQPDQAILAYLSEVTDAARAELGDEGFDAAFGRGRTSVWELVNEELARRPAVEATPTRAVSEP